MIRKHSDTITVKNLRRWRKSCTMRQRNDVKRLNYKKYFHQIYVRMSQCPYPTESSVVSVQYSYLQDNVKEISLL